ncbi:MAG: DUF1365 domain-containing protein [Hydrogenophilaceae bacterium]|jgi:hypothetical protein|nr:DUF1365 domain-containing protein [Hydrogenophilaceae bacterium]
MSAPSPCLYECRTVHVRMRPFVRRFSYCVRLLLLDVDALDEPRGLRLLRRNRPGLFSFFDKDHGDRSGAPLRGWVEAKLAAVGAMLEGGPIRVLAFPRVLGRAFSPLTIFFGYGPDGRLRGVVYEVNNTFGETHAYAAAIAPDAAPCRHAAPKRFHVSPFFDVAGGYRFTLAPPGERFSLVVENRVDQETEHVATLTGRRRALTDGALCAAFLRAPWAGIGVIAAIHWQAFWIWLRGARYRPKPAPPLAEMTPASHNRDEAIDASASCRSLDHAA